MHNKFTKQVFFLLPFFWIFCSCGSSAEFTGNVKTKAPPPPIQDLPQEPADPPPEVAPVDTGVAWLWECQNPLEGTQEKVDDRAHTLHGKGTYRVPVDSEGRVFLNFSGSFCPFVLLPRDIIFTIDASSSMMEHDPEINNSCGRLAALNTTLATLPDNGVQYAIVMFSDTILFQSTKLFSSRDELFADIVKQSGLPTVSNTICTSNSTTDYDSPLTQSKNLLTLGSPDATKEIFFISDGEPNIGEGKDIAKELKEKGVTLAGSNVTVPVTIATIMLGDSDDSVLKNDIASLDQDKQPLHARVKDSQDLAKVLAALATNKIIGGELKFRGFNTPQQGEDCPPKNGGECPNGQSDCTDCNGYPEQTWTVFQLERMSEDVAFSLPLHDYAVQEVPNGIEVIYTYWDRMMKKFESSGSVYWDFN